MNKDKGISLVGVIAMLSIVICHFLQRNNNTLAWWFNVGVPIFICISAYLYGKKEIFNFKEFYQKRMLKILVPVYI